MSILATPIYMGGEDVPGAVTVSTIAVDPTTVTVPPGRVTVTVAVEPGRVLMPPDKVTVLAG